MPDHSELDSASKKRQETLHAPIRSSVVNLAPRTTFPDVPLNPGRERLELASHPGRHLREHRAAVLEKCWTVPRPKPPEPQPRNTKRFTGELTTRLALERKRSLP